MTTLHQTKGNVRRALTNNAKQVRFGAAVALTRVAKDAQAEVKRQLPRRFIIRTTRAAKGIRITPATKNRLGSKVRVLDRWLAQHEEGFVKTQKDHALSIPIGARRRPSQTTPRSRWPGALMQRGGHFIGTTASGASAMFKRMGRKGKKRKLMYLFAESVDVPDARLGFEETVRDVVTSRLPTRMREEVNKAMRSAR